MPMGLTSNLLKFSDLFIVFFSEDKTPPESPVQMLNDDSWVKTTGM